MSIQQESEKGKGWSQSHGTLGTHNSGYGKAPESNSHGIAAVGTGNMDKSTQLTTFRRGLVAIVGTG